MLITDVHGNSRFVDEPIEQPNLGVRIMWVLWPSFLLAGIGEMAFFALVDPLDLNFYGEPLPLSRQAIYTLGFFFFWALGAAASALTVFLQRSPWELNRCPLTPTSRPVGCPKREDEPDCC